VGAALPLVVSLDEQPVVLGFSQPPPHPHEMPAAVKFLALQAEVEVAFLQPSDRIAFGIPAPAIPDEHGPAAIFALRDGAFERIVFDRVVLDLDREALLPRYEARSARHRPALHHPAKLKPQIVMKAARRMLLNDELMTLAARHMPARLRRNREFAFAAISLEAAVGAH